MTLPHSPELVRRNFRIDVFGGVCAGLYAAVLLAFMPVVVRRMGGSSFEVALVVAAPFIGHLLSPIGIYLLSGLPAVRVVAGVVTASRAVFIAGVLVATTPLMLAMTTLAFWVITISNIAAYTAVMAAIYPGSERAQAMGKVRIGASIAGIAAASDQDAELRAGDLDPLAARDLLDLHVGIDPHDVQQRGKHLRSDGKLFTERRCRLLVLVRRPGGHPAAWLRAPVRRTARHLGLIHIRLGLEGLGLLVRKQDARVLAAHAEHVRRLAPVEDLDVHLIAAATELAKAALDRLLDAAAAEFVAADGAHRLRLLLPRRRLVSCWTSSLPSDKGAGAAAEAGPPMSRSTSLIASR